MLKILTHRLLFYEYFYEVLLSQKQSGFWPPWCNPSYVCEQFCVEL